MNEYHLAQSLTDGQKEFIVGGLFFSMLKWIQDNGGQSSRENADQILGLLKM